MSGNIFGWSLPPGCSTLPSEEQLTPPQCEDCQDYDEDTQKCPYGDWATDNVNFDKCPKVSTIEKCDNCKKEINMVRADIPKEHTAYGNDTCFCCSESCAKELQDKIDKEFEEDKKYLKRQT